MAETASVATGEDAEGVTDGAEGDAEGPGEDGAGDDGEGAGAVVTGVPGAGVRENDGELAAGRELAVRCDGGAVVTAGRVQDGVPDCGGCVPAGALVPWPLSPPGVVATTDGARAGYEVVAYLTPAADSAITMTAR